MTSPSGLVIAILSTMNANHMFREFVSYMENRFPLENRTCQKTGTKGTNFPRKIFSYNNHI